MQAGVARDRSTEIAMLLMVVATLAIPAADAIAKVLGQSLSPGQIVWLRLALQIVLLAPLVARRPMPIARSDRLLHLMRGLLLAVATTCFFWSLTVLPLADAIAMFFIQPLILTVLAGVFLKEGIGWRRLSAAVIGFGGVMLVVQPGFTAFGPHALLPPLAGFLFAVYLLLTRVLAVRSDAVTLQFTAGVAGFLVISVLMALGGLTGAPLFAWSAPDLEAWSLLLLLGAMATVVHLLIVQAFRLGSAVVLAPMQYLELLGAVFWGWLIFGEWPNATTWIGITIIAGCGLYVFHRERRRAVTPAVASRGVAPAADD